MQLFACVDEVLRPLHEDASFHSCKKQLEHPVGAFRAPNFNQTLQGAWK